MSPTISLTIEEVKIRFIAAFKRAKSNVSTIEWCCTLHHDIADAIIKSYSDGKNRALADHKAQRLTDDTFKLIIMGAVELLDAFSDDMEVIFQTDDLSHGVRFNARSPKEIQ